MPPTMKNTPHLHVPTRTRQNLAYLQAPGAGGAIGEWGTGFWLWKAPFHSVLSPIAVSFLLAPPALPGVSQSLLLPGFAFVAGTRVGGAPSGRLPATAPNGLQRIYPLDLSVGSIRWIYPLDSVVSRATGGSPRGVISHILSPLEMVWTGTVPSPPLSPPHPPPGGGAVPAPRLSPTGGAGWALGPARQRSL